MTFNEIEAAVERARQRLSRNPAFVAELEARGRQRALVYKMAVLTGLRRGELASLAVRQVQLDGPVPYVGLHARDDKSREGSEVPLRRDLADDLRHWLVKKAVAVRGDGGATLPLTAQSGKLPPESPLFDVPRSLLNALNRDLAVAGIAKIDERGRSLDVHALRHTFGTLLSKSGVAPRTAQAAMRHSEINLTMNVYTDPKLLDVAGAVAALPTLQLACPVQLLQEQRATGTEDISQFAPEFAPTPGNRGSSESNTDNLHVDKVPLRANRGRRRNPLCCHKKEAADSS